MRNYVTDLGNIHGKSVFIGLPQFLKKNKINPIFNYFFVGSHVSHNVFLIKILR